MAKGLSNPPRGPTLLPDDIAAHIHEPLAKSVSKAWGVSLLVPPLTFIGSAVVVAATVRSWPAVVAVAIVLIYPLVWVALGPTISSWAGEPPRPPVFRQHQLSFARRAPLPDHRPTYQDRPNAHGKEDSLASPPTLQIADTGHSTAEIRAWARQQGCDVRRCGPLSNALLRAYDEAHGGVERRDIQPPTKIIEPVTGSLLQKVQGSSQSE
jgi:hypothetical protein